MALLATIGYTQVTVSGSKERVLAVIVCVVNVRKLTLKFLVPLAKFAAVGMVAAPSEDVIVIELLAVEILLKFSSTAFTVMLNVVPLSGVAGFPVLPSIVPGALRSPGNKSCSLLKAPGFTVIEGLRLAVFEPLVTSVARIVLDPAVLNFTGRVIVPLNKDVFGGSTALTSVDVILITSADAVLKTFQAASTAFTVMSKAVPAF